MVKKEINYLSKDFPQYRKQLIDFVKQYFPNTYNDFNESSPGMMNLEIAAMVGDVLSFYVDNQMKENFPSEAEERKNIFTIARSFGYKPKNTIPANVKLDVFQIVPAIGSGNNVRPDYNYALRISENFIVGSKSNSNVQFRTLEPIDFSYSSSLSPTDVSIYQVNSSTPEYYLLRKSVNAVSGRIISSNYSFSEPKQYDKIELEQENIIEVIDVYDSDGNRWYEVPYLSQEMVFESVENISKNFSNSFLERDQTPYILNVKKVSRRFISNVTSENKIHLQFGAGISSEFDEDLVPNPDLIGNELFDIKRSIIDDIDPSNFLKTRSYGLAPSNTTLTVRYSVGGGIQDNVPSNDLTEIITKNYSIQNRNLDETLLNFVKNSVRVINPEPASGGKYSETEEEIKNNTISNFSTQNRIVTKEDYIIRTYAMPQKYGSVAKAYVVKDDQINREINSENNTGRIINPYGVNVYVLGYDNNLNLTNLNNSTKQNLIKYLDQFRPLTDSINIKNAYIINIGLEFEIIARPNYNNNEVLVRCINRMREYFDIKKWQINQPILISNIYTELDKIEGVQTVSNVSIINLWNETDGYSGNIYNIEHSIRDNILYPSLDPSIFEIKYPDSDIRGRVKTI